MFSRMFFAPDMSVWSSSGDSSDGSDDAGDKYTENSADGDDLGDALGSRCEDVVGLAEGLFEREAAVHLDDVLVVDDQ